MHVRQRPARPTSLLDGDRSYYGDVSGCSNIRECKVMYENSERVGNMQFLYYQNIQPYYHAVGSGYHEWYDAGKLMYSFSLDVNSFDHTGYVDFGKQLMVLN